MLCYFYLDSNNGWNGTDDKPRDGGQAQDETRDNRSLVDNNTAQTLSSEDIEAMKR